MLAHKHRAHIAAGDKRTAEAGKLILAAGGNAIDAAVGATFAACAAEPVLTGPFGGGFCLLAQPHKSPVAYDLFAAIPGLGLPPAQETPGLDFCAKEVSFGPTTQVFHGGRGAAAVPLLLPGLMQLHEEHGRLPFEQVLQPAIALAEKGVALSEQIAPIAKILTPILTLTPETTALFAPQGHVLRAGEIFRNEELAKFLRTLGAARADDAQSLLLDNFGPPAGRLTLADLNGAKVMRSTPIMIELGPYTVALNPPPSLGGLLVGFGLRLLADVPEDVWRDPTQSACMLLACMAATQGARSQAIDSAVRQGPAALARVAGQFLDDDYVARWHDLMQESFVAGAPVSGFPEVDLGSTTHVSVIDAQGVACSITTSNGEGCGHLVPGTGTMANNFLGEEDINPAGFHVRPPGERMTSMMCPTVVLHNGVPVLALGTGGSNRIRTALLQVLVHHLLRHQPLDMAVKHPRLHYEGGPLFLEREVFGTRVADETLAALEKRVSKVVHFDAPNMFFGGVHVARHGDLGVGDPRRGGTVAAV